MAATKKATEQNNAPATTQEGAVAIKKAQGYKVIGEHFKGKNEANNAIKEIHKKGFKSAGLCVRENEFVIDICCIKQIGEDVILVEVNLEKCIRKCKY